MSAQDVAQWLETAHLPGAVARYTRLNQFDQGQIALEIARWERIKNNDHAIPDKLPIFHGNRPDYSNKSGLPRVLFGPREEHYADIPREAIRHGDRAYDNVAKETMETTLQARMGTDAQLPLDPPSLHDQIEAAWSAHSPEEK